MKELEMLIFALTALFIVAAIATLIALADTALRARRAYVAIKNLQGQQSGPANLITVREVTVVRRSFTATRPQKPAAFNVPPLRAAA